jgi:hypothetical protein
MICAGREVVDRRDDFLMVQCSPRYVQIPEEIKERDHVPKWNDAESVMLGHLRQFSGPGLSVKTA